MQEGRPNKRLFRVTDEGLADMERFAARAAKPSFIRDDLLVKVQAVDGVAAAPVVEQLAERAAVADAKIDVLERLLVSCAAAPRRNQLPAHGQRVGPDPTLSARPRLQRETRDRRRRAAALLGRAGRRRAVRAPVSPW
ncbi:PadR family transcriptional regulator OS=Streptomyces alboniger OX=132473 GN=CP975_03870 PE=4 SV=1 [Streptomyces alboniger]